MSTNDIILLLSAFSCALAAALVILTLAQIRRVGRLEEEIESLRASLKKAGEDSARTVTDELNKQRSLITMALSDINDNLTRGVVNMNRSNRED